ncbi:MAG: hypothetical protein ACERKZ_04370 [Lachnotalea sp.]
MFGLSTDALLYFYSAAGDSNLGNKVSSIPWFRTKTVDCLYTGSMGIPCELSLLKKQSLLKGFQCNIAGAYIAYDSTNGILKVEDSETHIRKNISDFCNIIDKGIIEISANNDIIYAVYEFAFKNDKKKIVFASNNL